MPCCEIEKVLEPKQSPILRMCCLSLIERQDGTFAIALRSFPKGIIFHSEIAKESHDLPPWTLSTAFRYIENMLESTMFESTMEDD